MILIAACSASTWIMIIACIIIRMKPEPPHFHLFLLYCFWTFLYARMDGVSYAACYVLLYRYYLLYKTIKHRQEFAWFKQYAPPDAYAYFVVHTWH